MTIKSILVHLADDIDHEIRLKTAFTLCRRFQARLMVLHVTTPISIPAGAEGRGASMIFMAEAKEIARTKAARLEDELSRWCAEAGVAYEWRRAEGDHLALLTEESLYHDLAIVSQSVPHNLEEMLFAELPDHLALRSSGPVLLLPHQCKTEDIGHHVLIAWKPCKEAARAVRAALPILKKAKTVTLMTADRDPAAHATLDAAAAYLSTHGVKPEVRLVDLDDMNHHDVILDMANSANADLIVMGGFSESRMKHLILGGETRRILTRTHTAVLMAH